MSGTLLKKITTKTVMGKVKEAIAGLGDKFQQNTPAMRVLGIANGVQTGESDYGPWVKFKGEFKATNLLTGEEFRSRSCMLPELASDELEAALSDENNDSVEFAVDVTVNPSENTIGYEYGIIPLVEAQRDDPLARLSSQVDGKLEAPQKKK